MRHTLRKFLDDFGRTISRAVIDYENFVIRRGEVLLKHAYNSLFDKLFVVVRVNQYADKRSRQLALRSVPNDFAL